MTVEWTAVDSEMNEILGIDEHVFAAIGVAASVAPMIVSAPEFPLSI